MNLPETVTINGQTYAAAELSDTAKTQLGNIRLVEAEIARLQTQLAIAQTARNAYVGQLVAALPKAEIAEQASPDAAAAEVPAKKPRKRSSKA